MSNVTFEWNGDRLIERVERAAREGVNETVDDARDDARATHTWKPSTRWPSDLETQIVSEHAHGADPNPTGKFGYTRRKGFYGLFHEEGTVHEHMFPALRPAADRVFPTLAARIREKLK